MMGIICLFFVPFIKYKLYKFTQVQHVAPVLNFITSFSVDNTFLGFLLAAAVVMIAGLSIARERFFKTILPPFLIC